ncbi:MAG: hypothetical protein QHH13_00905 [Melioribacter sp.]|uniref:hypothetical protein n=1 Tax=Rosettibacter primus TaxID=3111523 RepID=UPI00247C3A98|nr:hypothetical protein [Melioribacter sp.]
MFQKVDIEKELRVLKSNVLHILSTYPYLNNYLDISNDSTFRASNWLVTFPYNFLFDDSNQVRYGNENNIEIIRKLAVINTLYGSFFLREDDVLDEYNLPLNEYKHVLIKMCYSRILHKLAVGQFLKLCGQEIYSYIFHYERKYYEALAWEKNNCILSSKTMFLQENLKYLGWKLYPLGITYAAFCILNNQKNKIPHCEELIIKYHIAHQLIDDAKDYKKDIAKPDYSYLIRAFIGDCGDDEISLPLFKQWISNSRIIENIIAIIVENLDAAKRIAYQLKFEYFVKQIEYQKSRLQQLDNE